MGADVTSEQNFGKTMQEPCVDSPGSQKHGTAGDNLGTLPPQRWFMLCLLSYNICVNYLPYYTFVPILPQAMLVYGVDESTLTILCILYALVYVPCVFLVGPLISAIGCRGAFVLAMVMTTAGCLIRCGPSILLALLESLLVPGFGTKVNLVVDETAPPFAGPAYEPFMYLALGQALCALGQPFLVNSTSQFTAEWFPPQQRPAAAMIANLMNFVGSSFSFMMPPLIVDTGVADSQLIHEQVAMVLWLQFAFSLFGLVLTVLFYQPSPAVPIAVITRGKPNDLIAEVLSFSKRCDFWLVNGQFMIYIGICHAFDAVEGVLLEQYGYSAALSSWTAVSCGAGSIFSTIAEAWYMSDATDYKASLVIVNILLASSLATGAACLYFQLPPAGFIFAIGIMGLAVPGWGCTIELSAEVCYPAREATVASFIEACSNLTGVATIVVFQRLLDVGLGAGVLVVMCGCSILGISMVLGFSGRLRRKEAEDEGSLARIKEISDKKNDIEMKASSVVSDKGACHTSDDVHRRT